MVQELRIGNYILFNEEDLVGKVLQIYQSPDGVDIKFEDEETYIGTYAFSGIKLTEEWLLRLGIVQNYINPRKWETNTRISLYKKDGYDYFIAQLDDVTIREVETVHDFQNIMFLFSREELTIKETIEQ